MGIPEELYFQGKLVATLSESIIEWPRNDSIYAIAEDIAPRMAAYIQMSIASTRLVDGDRGVFKTFVEQEESKYLDVINSEEWMIVDSVGEEYGVLAPIFHPDNIMVWMER